MYFSRPYVGRLAHFGVCASGCVPNNPLRNPGLPTLSTDDVLGETRGDTDGGGDWVNRTTVEVLDGQSPMRAL